MYSDCIARSSFISRAKYVRLECTLTAIGCPVLTSSPNTTRAEPPMYVFPLSR